MFRRPQPENFVNYQLQASLGRQPNTGRIPIKRRKRTKIKKDKRLRPQDSFILRAQDVDKHRAVYRPDRLLALHQSSLNNATRTALEMGRGLTATGTTLGFERQQLKDSSVEKAKGRVLLALANRLESKEPFFGYAGHRLPDDLNSLRLPNRPIAELEYGQARPEKEKPLELEYTEQRKQPHTSHRKPSDDNANLQPLLQQPFDAPDDDDELDIEEVTPTPRKKTGGPPPPPPPPPAPPVWGGRAPPKVFKEQPRPEANPEDMFEAIRNFKFKGKSKPVGTTLAPEPEPEPEPPPQVPEGRDAFLTELVGRSSKPREFKDPLQDRQAPEPESPAKQSELFNRISSRRDFTKPPDDDTETISTQQDFDSVVDIDSPRPERASVSDITLEEPEVFPLKRRDDTVSIENLKQYVETLGPSNLGPSDIRNLARQEVADEVFLKKPTVPKSRPPTRPPTPPESGRTTPSRGQSGRRNLVQQSAEKPPKGFHRMPDGSIMKDEDHPKPLKQNFVEPEPEPLATIQSAGVGEGEVEDVEESEGSQWLDNGPAKGKFRSGKKTNKPTGQTYSFVDTKGLIGKGKFKGKELVVVGYDKGKYVNFQLKDTFGTGVESINENEGRKLYRDFKEDVDDGDIVLKRHN